jgi:AcrR family transcriptional regulator
MGVNERKKREHVAFQAFLAKEAYRLIEKKGLESLSMRTLAQQVEWSTQKLYSTFRNKERLLHAVAEYLRGRLWELLSTAPKTGDSVEDLIQLSMLSIHFFIQEPHAFEVLLHTHYEPDAKAQEKSSVLYEKAFRVVHCSSLRTDADVQTALQIIRFFVAGAISSILRTKDPKEHRSLIRSVDTGLRTLLRGWGAFEDA